MHRGPISSEMGLDWISEQGYAKSTYVAWEAIISECLNVVSMCDDFPSCDILELMLVGERREEEGEKGD